MLRTGREALIQPESLRRSMVLFGGTLPLHEKRQQMLSS